MKNLILSSIGGFLYVLIEIAYRGYSHPSMFILGAGCFICVGYYNEYFSWETPLYVQSIIGGLVITILEFFTGCIVNLWLKWNVWDYSNMDGNILGQVCIPFFFVWCGISVLAIILDDWLRYVLFEEEKPRYKLM